MHKPDAAIALDAPRFGLVELRELRHALNQSRLYVGPVGISTHATGIWKEASRWVGRLDSLIAETEEWEAEINADARTRCRLGA